MLKPSQCMICGHKLSLIDRIPIFSYIFLKGRCRWCKCSISFQYPIIEAINGLLSVLIFLINGFTAESVIFSLFASALIVIAVIDWKTYEIPIKVNIFILCLGILRIVLDIKHFQIYFIGFFGVSALLLVIYFATVGRAIGGGDIKLMAVAGLILGWQLIILAFFIGCILGSIIHIIRMRAFGEGKVLAMGPYLSAGILIAMMWGNNAIDWYLNVL